MDDYISRQKLLKDIEQYHLSDGKFQYWVEVQPSADVMPVVRCKDCKHWNDAPANDGFNSCEMDALIRHESFFCANGERKDGKQ